MAKWEEKLSINSTLIKVQTTDCKHYDNTGTDFSMKENKFEKNLAQKIDW